MWRLFLLLGVVLILFLFITGSALASAIVVNEGEWFIYNHSQAGCYFMMAPIVTDFQCGTAGAQVAILSPEKRPICASHTYFNERTGTYYEYIYAFDHQLTISPAPQLTTLDGSGLLPQDRVGLEVLDTYSDPRAKAAEIYDAGYWKLYYDDNTSEVVDDYPSCPLCFNPYEAECNDPLLVATGTSYNTMVDVSVPAKGGSLIFARTNRSLRAAQPGTMGNGWRHNYETSLSFPDASTVMVFYPDACMCTFVLVPGSSGAFFIGPAGNDDKLTKQPDGSYTLKEKSGITYLYTSAGVLSGVSDRYGNQTVISYSGSLVTDVTDSSGRSLHLIYSGGHVVEAQARTNGVTQQSVTYTYNAGGDLTSSTDANGHTTGYTYNAAHQLLSIRQPRAMADPTMNPLFTNTWANTRVTAQSDALGNSSSLAIDRVSRTSTVTDARDNETIYTWDDNYSLTGLIDPLGGTWSIAYSAKGHPTAVTDPNDNTVRMEYDANSNATSYHDAEGHIYRALYDASNNPLWVQDPLGERLTRTTTGLLARDDFGSNSLSSYTQASEGGSAPVWTFESGLLNQTLRHYATASLRRNNVSGAACATAYLTPKYGGEAVADLLVATGAVDGLSKAFVGYDARISTTAASIQRRNAAGTWTELAAQSYTTAFGTYRLVRLYVEDGTVYMKAGSTDFSQVSLSATDSTYTSGSGGIRAASQCSYDFLELRASQKVTVTGLPSGYLVRVTRGSATAEATPTSGTATIDTSGMLFPLDKLEVFDTSAVKVAELTSLDLTDMGGGDEFAYDDDPGHRTTFAWDATGTFLDSVTSPVGTTSFDWNTDGSLDSVTDANNHTWEFAYNARGDFTSLTDPLSFVTTFERDAAGRVTAVEDANSSRYEYTRDAKDNLTCVKDPLAELDPQNRHQIDVGYDINDNLTEVEDARGNVTSFSYDGMNRLVLVEDALSGEGAFTYDANHNLAGVEDPNGNVTSYVHDECNRLASITNALTEEIEYSYDPVGNLTGLLYPNGNETTFAYNAIDALSGVSYANEATTWSFSYNPANFLSMAEKNDGKTWTFTYDGGNRPIGASDENNPVLGTFDIECTYDGVSNVTGIDIGSVVSLVLTYDARDSLATLVDAGGTTSFTHDDGGRLTQIATPEGSTRSVAYDAASHPTEVENVTESGTQTFTYLYDANGNPVSDGQTTYAYDALNRIIEWYNPGTDVTTTYAYDPAGNLTLAQEDGITTESYGYNAGNEITNLGFAYDANGNLTSDGFLGYFYDSQNQLKQVTAGGTALCSMTYDYAGRRSALTTSSGTTYFHWVGTQLAAESDGTGAVTATYAYAPEGGLVSMTRGGETYYYQTNAHGDVVSLTDDSGAVVNTYAYDPWGKLLSAVETVENPFRYAGYYYDDLIQLYYLWHRYYDPELKRFLTQDVLGGVIQSTQSINRYCYAMNRPLVLIDPFGLSAVDDYEGEANEANMWYYNHYKASKHWYEKVGFGLGIVLTFPSAFAETLVSMTAEDSTYEGNNPVQTVFYWTVGVTSSLFTGENLPEVATFVIAPELFITSEAFRLFLSAFDLFWRLFEQEAW